MGISSESPTASTNETKAATVYPMHTPGPWRISDLDRCVVGPVRMLKDRNSGTEIQQMQAVARVSSRTGETAANANLIAAAPRMYERIVKLASDGDAEALAIVEQVHERS
jgi:hypothetical protein